MRTLRLKKCNRIHGLHFTPDGRQLLVVGGEEAEGINDIAWFDLATGAVLNRLEVLAGGYVVSNDFRRLVIGLEAYDEDDAGQLIQFCNPLDDEDTIEWQVLPTGLSWSRGTSAIVPDGLALTPDGSQVYV